MANEHPNCQGCQYQHEGEGWCYMFGTAPSDLPCTQHDKFKIEQAMMSALIIKRPALLMLLVANLIIENK